LNNVHQIFPTALFESTISVSNTEEILEDLNKKYSSCDEYTHHILEKNKTSFYTEDTLHENPIYFDLKSQIETIAEKVFDAYSYQNIIPRVETMWGNVLGYNG